MVLTGRTLSIVAYFIFSLVLIIHNFVLVSQMKLSTILISLIFLPIFWWIGKIYDRMMSSASKAKIRSEEIVEDNKQLNLKINRIEEMIDTIDDIAVFSYEQQSKEFNITKGAEHIFGFSHKELTNNPVLLQQAIHPDDKGNVEILSFLNPSSNEEFRITRPNGEVRWVIQRENLVKDADGKILKMLGSIVDITDRKKMETKLNKMAYYDNLTDLANRALLNRDLKKAIARSNRHNHQLGLMFLDLDGFKKVNDTLGHDAGDLLLKEVARRLNENVREEDFIARLGGDEFIIVFEETGVDEVEDIAKRTIEKISLPYLIDEKEAKISPSIGISMFPDHGEDVETLIKHADKAMYYSKSKGKGIYQFYRDDLPEISNKKPNVINKIVNSFQNLTNSF